jgi:hypothetical protein
VHWGCFCLSCAKALARKCIHFGVETQLGSMLCRAFQKWVVPQMMQVMNDHDLVLIHIETIVNWVSMTQETSL